MNVESVPANTIKPFNRKAFKGSKWDFLFTEVTPENAVKLTFDTVDEAMIAYRGIRHLVKFRKQREPSTKSLLTSIEGKVVVRVYLQQSEVAL